MEINWNFLHTERYNIYTQFDIITLILYTAQFTWFYITWSVQIFMIWRILIHGYRVMLQFSNIYAIQRKVSRYQNTQTITKHCVKENIIHQEKRLLLFVGSLHAVRYPWDFNIIMYRQFWPFWPLNLLLKWANLCLWNKLL